MEHLLRRSLLALSIFIHLCSIFEGEAAQPTFLEEKTHPSEFTQELPSSAQFESQPDLDKAKRTEFPLLSMTYWAIPFLSPQEAHQLYQMLDEDTKAQARQLISVQGFLAVHQTLTLADCQEYFGKGGLFEYAKKVRFRKVQIDVKCFNYLPKTLTDLTLEKSEFIHHEIHFSERIWIEVLETIANTVPQLQILSIDPNRRGPQTAYFQKKAVAVIAKKMISLRQLLLKNIQLTDKRAKILALGDFPHLTHLNLQNNDIGSEGAKTIAKHFTHLMYLNLSANSKIGPERATTAIAFGNLTSLKHLNLSFCKIDATDSEALALGNLKSLTYLDLSWNQLGNQGAEAIASGDMKNLTHLDLSWNKIGHPGTQAIARGNLKSLKYLDLSFNRIDSRGALSLAQGKLNHLTHLDLLWNEIDLEESQMIQKALSHLNYLDLRKRDKTKCSPAIQERILRVFEHME